MITDPTTAYAVTDMAQLEYDDDVLDANLAAEHAYRLANPPYADIDDDFVPPFFDPPLPAHWLPVDDWLELRHPEAAKQRRRRLAREARAADNCAAAFAAREERIANSPDEYAAVMAALDSRAASEHEQLHLGPIVRSPDRTPSEKAERRDRRRRRIVEALTGWCFAQTVRRMGPVVNGNLMRGHMYGCSDVGDAEDLAIGIMLDLAVHNGKTRDLWDPKCLAHIRAQFVHRLDTEWQRWKAAERDPRVIVPVPAEGGENFGGPAPIDDTDLEMDLDRAMACLTSKQAAVIRMRVYGRAKWGDIAEVMGVSINAVKDRYNAGLTAMRKCLGDDYLEALR